MAWLLSYSTKKEHEVLGSLIPFQPSQLPNLLGHPSRLWGNSIPLEQTSTSHVEVLLLDIWSPTRGSHMRSAEIDMPAS